VSGEPKSGARRDPAPLIHVFAHPLIGHPEGVSDAGTTARLPPIMNGVGLRRRRWTTTIRHRHVIEVVRSFPSTGDGLAQP
jgi:hypothetical protein